MGPRLRINGWRSISSRGSSLHQGTARLGRTGAGLLLAIGLAGTLEPLIQVVSSSPAAAQANLIQNGSFESPQVSGCSVAYTPGCDGFTTYSSSSDPNGIDDWTIGGDSVDLVNTHWVAESGNQSVDLSGNAPGSVSQSVTTTSDETYTLSWYMAGNPDGGAAIKTMHVYWNGTLVDEPSFDTAGHTVASMGWVEEQVNVTATSTSSTVEFADASSPATPYGATLDNVSLLPANLTSCSSSSFSDNFAEDSSLSDCWETGTPLLSDVASDEGAQGMAPQLSFDGSYMDMQGVTTEERFTGIQSANAYSTPLEFETSVDGLEAHGNPFMIYLVNANGTEGFTVDGNPDSMNTPYYGLWGNDGIGADEDNTPLLTPNDPSDGVVYNITMSIDGTGNGNVTVSYSGAGATTTSLGNIGTTAGPFYVVLGQWEGVPNVGGGANEAAWYSANMNGSSTVTASLSTTSPTVAGVETVPTSAVPASSVGSSSSGSGDAASAPLGSIPLGSIGLAASPLGSIPLGSIPLGSIAVAGSPSTPGLTTAAQALSSTLLSDVGITFPPGCGPTSSPCTGWEGVLTGSEYAGVPLQTVTLANVLEDTTTGTGGVPSPATNFDSLDLASLDLSSSPLGSIPLGSIELGSTPLGSISLPGAQSGATGALTEWCTVLDSLSPAFPCSDFGIDPSNPSSAAGVSLLSLALAGVPLGSIPLGSIPLGSIALGSSPLGSIPLGSIDLASNPLGSIPLGSIPLGSIPLGSIPLGSIPLGSIPLGSIPLGSIPLGSIPLGSIQLDTISNLSTIVDCSSGFSCTGATLADAQTENAILPTAELENLPSSALAGTTLADLPSSALAGTTVGDLPSSAFAGTTVGELVSGDDTSYAGYPSVTLNDLLLLTIPPTTYPWQTVTLARLPLAADEIANGGGTVTYSAALTVSGIASTVQVSATLPPTFAYVPDSTTLDGTQVVNPTAGASLNWTLPALSPGTHTLSFEANAGIGLGPTTATLTASIDGTLNATSSATVDVVDGEEPAINAASTALTLTPGTPDTTPATEGNLNIGYLTSQGDLNDWTVNVPQNDELSLALTNLPANYDLELFGPGTQQLQGTPNQDLSGVSDTLPSLTPDATTEATPGSQDLPIAPPSGDQLEAISNNPDGQSQYIQTPPLAAGTYIVQVSGYNGAFSSQPYLLQANLLGGGTAPSCSGGISYLSSLLNGSAPVTPPTDLNTTIPSNVNTLFLVNTQRLSAAFPSAFDDAGNPSQQTIVSDLDAIASDSSAGVRGAIVPVDSYQSVQTAYAAWNANPCSVAAANGVVAAISSVVDQLRSQDPTIQNIVIVGADDQIPFARIADGATQSNERDYGAATFAGEDNPEADALSLGYYLSDDPYAANSPLGVGSATLYTPQVAVGRLVENASEIESALSRFVSSGGNLDATASLTTGYSFLTSGAEAVSTNLAANKLSAFNLINENWQESDLDSALAGTDTDIREDGIGPGVDSINAHFDYSRALPAYDNTNNLTSNLFTTTDVRNVLSSYAGRLLFSMGCHAGLDVDDAEVVTSGVTIPVDDWAKTFADAGALWVANTGYGYADTDTIAYSAKLMTDFAANLNGTLTIGEALTEAKQQYAAGNAILSPYDLKALMESTFYGLPMYSLNGSSAPATPPSGPGTTTDPATGLTVAPVSVSLQPGTIPGEISLVTTANGSYYQVNGTTPYNAGTQATEYRPIEPLVAVPATESGLIPHGALVSGLISTDVPGFKPAYSMPAAGSADAMPPSIGDAAFPGALQRVATYGTFTSNGTGEGAQLDLVAGQFLPNLSSPGTGTERLFTSIAGQVYYVSPSSPLANDYTPATIDTSQAVSGSSLTFSVQVTPSSAPVKQVLVLYTDASSPGTWTSVNLTSSDGQNWTGTAPSTLSGKVQYIVEAVDAAGNVAVSNNEGTAFNATTQPAISIALSGSGPTNGYYTSAVTATITAPNGSTYVLDGSAPVSVSGPVMVTTSGEHTLTVTDQNGDESTQAFAISMSQTSTALSSGTSSPVVGQQVTLTATVTPLSTGLSNSPTGNVEFFDGTMPIPACNGTTGEGLTGGTATCAVAFGSPGTHQITAGYVSNDGFAASTSGAVGLAVSLRSATVSGFTVSNSPATYGAETNLSFWATVTAGDSDPFPNSDTVTVSQGTTSICTITLSNVTGNSGSGSCTPTVGTVLPAGTDTVTATFNANGADPNFATTPPTTASATVDKAGTKTILELSASSATYGSEQSVTFTSTVSPQSSGTPSGTIKIESGSTTLCSITLPSSVCTTTGNALAAAVSPYSITAVYGGDGNFTGSTSTTVPLQVFSQSCITTSVPGPLTISKGQVICMTSGGKVTGPVTVSAGGGLWTSGGTITGALSSTGAIGITICGTTVTGAVSVTGSTGAVQVGGSGCKADTITGAVTLTGNSAGVSFGGNHLTGALNVSSNAGGVTISGNTQTGNGTVSSNSGGVTFTGNTMVGSLVITNNSGGFTFSGNSISGSVTNTGNH
jgi:choice-of-anchor C domain-containing protein